MGEVHVFPAKVPPFAVHVMLFVAPPVAVALKACVPGAIVWLAGVIAETMTLAGVTAQVVVAVAPPAPVTVRVYVFADVIAGDEYELPLTADAVISELLSPADPITADPPEKVGIRVVTEL